MRRPIQVNKSSAFTEDQVRHVRKLAKDGWTAGEIARSFGEMGLHVATETVRKVIRRETWAWVTDLSDQGSGDLSADAAASAARVLQELTGQTADDASVVQRMEQATKDELLRRRLGDSMIEELKGEQK